MTAHTPVYGLEYIVEGEPLRNARLALENNAKSVEAALLLGGVAAPGATDLLTLSGRVNLLESTAWANLSLASGVTNLGGEFQTAQIRKVGDRVELRGVLAAKPAGTILATIPAGMRPPATSILSSNTDATTSNSVYVYPDGRLTKVQGGNSFTPLLGMFWFTS